MSRMQFAAASAAANCKTAVCFARFRLCKVGCEQDNCDVDISGRNY
jgi:hypothetical protein